MQQERFPLPSAPEKKSRGIIVITMSVSTSLTIKTVIIAAILLLASAGFAYDSPTTTSLLQFLQTEHTPSFPLLPAALPHSNIFKPGTTTYAGTVIQLHGTAYVYHKDGTVIYTLKKNLPIFTGDTLVTGKNSRLTFLMNDQSTVTLTSQSKLVIDKALPWMKVRDTTLHLFFGRIRAFVKKLNGEYKVKTPTGSIGVRGTDFAVAVAPFPVNNLLKWKKNRPVKGILTAVLTGGNHSTVALTGHYGPSVMIKPFSASGVLTGGRAMKSVHIGPTAIPLLQRIAKNKSSSSSPGLRIFSGLPKKKPRTIAPCWPFTSVRPKNLTFFKVCEPAHQAPVNIWSTQH